MKTAPSTATCLLVLLVGSAGPTPTQATSPFELIFDGSIANAGLLGGADVDPNGDHWLIGFGAEQRLRRIRPVGSGWSGSTSVLNIELTLFGRADDLAAGNRNLDWGGQIGLSPGALLLNPAALTIDVPTGAGGTQSVTYPAGTLAFIADNVGNPIDPSGQSRHELTKKLYRFDLRQTADPTSVEPDFPSNRGFPGGPVVGQTGWADWYDVFQHVVSEQDLRNISGSTGSSTFGRQFAWSSDGQSIYAVDSGAGQGGIYRIDPTRTANDPGGIERVLDSPSVPSGSFRVRSEPAILSTSEYDYAPDSPAVGDQILVEGNFTYGNEGGVNVFVDTGGATLGDPTVLFTADEFRDFADYYSVTTSAVNDEGTTIVRNRSPRYISLAAAPNGDLYGYEQQTDVMFRYDTQGRFSKVGSEREHNLFQQVVTGSFGNDDMSNLSIGTSTEPGFEVTQLTFVDSTINAPVALLVYEPGDFDRDNDVDADDLNAFGQALSPRNVVADDADVVFDMNGNPEAFRGFDNILGTPDNPDDDIPYIRHVSNEGVVVDWKDVKILQQFAEFPNGDTNFDMALDLTDLTTMSQNYHTLGGVADETWITGDFASIDPRYLFDVEDANLVDEIDLAVIADAWLNDLGQPAPDEATLNGLFSGQFLTDVIAAFSAEPGLPGDYDADGDVDLDDYAVWAADYGEALDAADGNGDGVVNAADYTVWRDAAILGGPLPGDANGDGVVDLLDLDVLGQNFGATSATFAQGDFNADGRVDGLDLDILSASYGLLPTASIPEPTGLAVVIGMALAAVVVAHRR